jgi:hypothetical protein
MQPVKIDSSRKRTMSSVALLSPEILAFARAGGRDCSQFFVDRFGKIGRKVIQQCPVLPFSRLELTLSVV